MATEQLEELQDQLNVYSKKTDTLRKENNLIIKCLDELAAAGFTPTNLNRDDAPQRIKEILAEIKKL
jgi:hypothetical protein